MLQGFTQRGQVLGAAAGPGANTQFVAVDVRDARTSLGAFVGRIRWDDALYTIPRPMSYTVKHHVTMYVGGERSWAHQAIRTHGQREHTAPFERVLREHRTLLFIDEQRSDLHNVTLQFSVGPRFN
ncbi:MAG: hypothetical protein U5K74_01505 [Gemmatimonadaceae bacterium]|nr:hypothetical protein [Gemmatimonadaceae bacterium]